MDISTQLTTVLKNFALINNSIVFKPGNTLRTINASQSVFAAAKFDTEFPVVCGIGDIAKFLNICSVFERPYVTFADKYLTVKDHKGSNKASYTYTDPVYIVAPPEREISLKSVEVEFDLIASNLTKMQRAIAIYEQPDYVIEGDGKTIIFKTANSDSPVIDSFSMEVGDTDRRFSLVFARENLPLMNMDYTVQLGKKSAMFGNDNVQYFVAAKANNCYFEDK